MEKYSEAEIFCKNIKALREYCDLSKNEMSKNLGISVKTLEMIESGIIPKRLSCKIVYRIYDKFDILPQNIFKPLYIVKNDKQTE